MINWQHKRYVLAVEDVDQSSYIMVNTSQQSSPFYPMSREFLDRCQALEFTDAFFDLGRRLRRKRSESREFARRMLYDWAVSLSMDRGLSGVLTTYANFAFTPLCFELDLADH